MNTMLNLLRYNAKPHLLALGTASLLNLTLLISSLFSQNSSPPSSDFNGNGVVDFPDFLLFVTAFGSQTGQERYDAKYDLDGNGEIAFDDFLLFVDSFAASSQPPPPSDPRLTRIELPEGFHIRIYAEGITGARSMSLSPDGTLFVGTRPSGRVYALRDEDGDHKAERVILLARDLNNPNGVAFKNGDLYVAEISRILRYRNIEAQLDNPPQPEIVNDTFPTNRSHGWKFIRFGPDGLLYVPVGAPCNICNRGDPYASIGRLDANGNFSIIARGIRNTVGFDWHPETGELWFTDNGRDRMGDDVPPDELNRITVEGQHFGYPYCHGTNIADPVFGDQRSCGEFVAPIQNLGPHVAALGMRFYTGDMFPEEYRNQIFIAEHGSWNRSSKIGYRVTLVRLNSNRAISYEPFAKGWLQGESNWGRPVDVLVMPDGSLLVSDDQAGLIYRISYSH
ncbi:MAG: PQQ-dependent sugar dehydrogenase [Gemmatimonadetes bacterium]|nr:PQQ-dependent sugar dehydrogenase [Gemmatimonadota bacterium]